MYKNILLIIVLTYLNSNTLAQKASIEGRVSHEKEPLEFVNIGLKGTAYGCISNSKGDFHLRNLPYGKYQIYLSHLGYEPIEQTIILSPTKPKVQINIKLKKRRNLLDQVVVTGTKTIKRQTETPIIVNILSSSKLENLQVCNLSESLKFQPGLRVETDCQTCNYTQVRMNGLQGGYSQILINGRPIFSPLMSLYGMEQLPSNMIDRIEVVRGGGSSLYGSSAIGGTINVITKIPKKNDYEINSSYQNIKGQASDYQTNANATLVSPKKNMGVSLFINHREREMYDANGDYFSETPLTENNSWGSNLFWKFNSRQKLELSISNLNEYRYGGEMVEKPAYLAQQSEERQHKIWMLNGDYQINFNEGNSSFISYAAWQNTNRKHYTGIIPDQTDSLAYRKHIENPPYGKSNTSTYQAGVQINHRLRGFLGGENTFSIGSEWLSEQVFDEIESYQYKIDQEVTNWGTFLQSDWDINSAFNLLSGIRFDQHKLLNNTIISPRIALLYKAIKNTQFRISYGSGFKAPQAFDTDLHIAFAGGGVSRVQLAKDLKQEHSRSWSSSINYDKIDENFIWGFTLEGFFTQLDDAFYLQEIGSDNFGAIFEKRNGQQATVKGITLELRSNYKKKIQADAGFTHQKSEYNTAISYLENTPTQTQFMRTPENYGFANLNISPNNKWDFNLNYVYTGSMRIAHAGGADNFSQNSIVKTKAFSELNSKISRLFHLHKFQFDLTIYLGVKNIFDNYQSDFDIGKNRDSNYIYGPQQARSIFIGFILKPE